MESGMDWKNITNEKEKYSAYLCSREWSIKKEAVKKRSGGFCERCISVPMYAVHHMTYERKYNENLSDLHAVCKPCHDWIHAKVGPDPMHSVPPLLGGVPVRFAYLAGKMNSPWRSEIIKADWNKSEMAGGDWDKVFLSNGQRLLICGPHFVPGSTGGHDYGDGEHGAAIILNPHDGPMADRGKILRDRTHEIDCCNLIFAWIDCRTCFGTIAEIGYAAAGNSVLHNSKRKLAIAVSDRDGLSDDLWFAAEMADYLLLDYSRPGDAWDDLWKEFRGNELKGGVIRNRNCERVVV